MVFVALAHVTPTPDPVISCLVLSPITNGERLADLPHCILFYRLLFLRRRETTVYRICHESFRRTAEAPTPTTPAASSLPATTPAVGEILATPERTRLPRRRRCLLKLAVGVLKSKSNDPQLPRRSVPWRTTGGRAVVSWGFNGGTPGD